jgi:hypothetical protein
MVPRNPPQPTERQHMRNTNLHPKNAVCAAVLALLLAPAFTAPAQDLGTFSFDEHLNWSWSGGGGGYGSELPIGGIQYSILPTSYAFPLSQVGLTYGFTELGAVCDVIHFDTINTFSYYSDSGEPDPADLPGSLMSFVVGQGWNIDQQFPEVGPDIDNHIEFSVLIPGAGTMQFWGISDGVLVPEPHSALLVCLGAAVFALRRKSSP